MEGEATEGGAVLCGEDRSGCWSEDEDLEKINNKTIAKNINEKLH